jgi:hypothetical protein
MTILPTSEGPTVSPGPGWARAVRRGLADTQIQAYLTATMINTAAVIALILVVRTYWRQMIGCSPPALRGRTARATSVEGGVPWR